MKSTRFGSVRTDPHSAVAVLRARAARAGVTPEPADTYECAAAAMAAELWCVLMGSTSLDTAAGHGDEARRAAAAILSRAAGRGGTPGEVPESTVAIPDTIDVAVDEWLGLLGELGIARTPVLARAAWDLAAGGRRFSGVAALLAGIAAP